MRSLLKRRSRAVPGPRRAIAHVVLTFRVYEADGHLVADCPQLGVSSFGEDVDDAIKAGVDAACVYLDELTAQGVVARVLEERGVVVHTGAPGHASDEVHVDVVARPGEVITPRTLDLPALAGIG